jgi:hypothetical protein
MSHTPPAHTSTAPSSRTVPSILRLASCGAIVSARAAVDTEATRGRDVIVRVEPGHVRIWDFADEYDGD